MSLLVRDPSLDPAVETVIQNYVQNTIHFDHYNDTDALAGFWRAKNPDQCIEYLEQKSGRNSVCFVFLPGGSCYGSCSEFDTFDQAREEVSKTALMHSLFNEHPMRKISVENIQQVIDDLRTKPATFGRTNVFDGCHSVLELFEDKSLMELNEFQSTLKLLHWSGYSQQTVDMGSRAQYFEHVRNLCFDDDLRSELALGLVEKELDMCGFIESQLLHSRRELRDRRTRRQELRCSFEQEQICLLAMRHTEREGCQEQLAPME